MAGEAVVDALVMELERAVKALRAAQRMAAELQRTPARRKPREEPAEAEMDLRFSGMTVAEAADALEVSEEHVRRLLRRGELLGVPYGGRTGWRLPREYVIQLRVQMEAAKEGKAAARQRLIPGSRPTGRPRKTRRSRSA